MLGQGLRAASAPTITYITNDFQDTGSGMLPTASFTLLGQYPPGLYVVGIAAENDSLNSYVSNVVFDGTTMTSDVFALVTKTGGGSIVTAIHSYNLTTSTVSPSITVNFTSLTDRVSTGVWRINKIQSTTRRGAGSDGSNNGSGLPRTLTNTLTIPGNSVGISVFCNSYPAEIVWAGGATERYNAGGGGRISASGAEFNQSITGSKSISATTLQPGGQSLAMVSAAWL